MAHELEAITLGEGDHFRDDDRLSAASAEPRQIRVVDDASRGRVAPEHQGFVQKALHHETLERAVELQVAALGIPQVEQAGDQLRPLPGELHLIRRGVMLHLGAWFVGHAVAAHRLAAAQFQVAQHPRQRGIADLDSLFLDQLLVHTLQPTVALAVQTFEQLGVDLNLILPLFPHDLSLLSDNGPHGIAAEVQAAADLPQGHPFLVQVENGVTHVRIDHETPPSC